MKAEIKPFATQQAGYCMANFTIIDCSMRFFIPRRLFELSCFLKNSLKVELNFPEVSLAEIVQFHIYYEVFDWLLHLLNQFCLDYFVKCKQLNWWMSHKLKGMICCKFFTTRSTSPSTQNFLWFCDFYDTITHNIPHLWSLYLHNHHLKQTSEVIQI